MAVARLDVHEEQARDGDGRGSDEGRAARGALWFATNSIVVKGAQTLVLLTLAATLAPSALGLVALGTLVVNVSAILGNLGTSGALVYWRGDVTAAARTAVTIGLVSASAMTLLLWFAAPAMASALRAEDGGAAVIRGLVVTLPALAVAAVTQELLRRELRFLRRVVPEASGALVGAVVAIVLATQGMGVMSLVAGQVVQGVLTLLLAWVVHPPVLPGWDAASARGLLSYGAPFAGANLLEVLQLNVDYLLVARVLGAVALGQYSLGFRIAYMPYVLIVLVVTGAAFPYLCRRRGESVGHAAEVVLTVLTALLAPLVVLSALAPEQLMLLGEKWAEAVSVLSAMALFSWVLGLTQAIQVALNASGLPGVAMRLRLLHLAGLSAALLLTVRGGVVAVAWTQTVVTAATALLAVALAARLVAGFDPLRWVRSLWPVLVGSGAAALALLAGDALGDATGLAAISVLRTVLLTVAVLTSHAAVLWLTRSAQVRAAWAVVRDAS
ncbi:MAG: oligosaccharide flippase family protein [Actinobacteria bacterium]|nr:oligosaccharide flippase family protein [Actinomycetota bacterium]